MFLSRPFSFANPAPGNVSEKYKICREKVVKNFVKELLTDISFFNGLSKCSSSALQK